MRNNRLKQMQATLDEVATMTSRVEVALVVRDPGTARSVEAYEGLRKAITGAMRERRQHLIQLVQISESLDRGATIEALKDLTDEWCSLAGLVRFHDTSQPDYFQVIEGEGPDLEPISPAWVDTSDPAAPVLIKPGTARRRPATPVTVAPTHATPHHHEDAQQAGVAVGASPEASEEPAAAPAGYAAHEEPPPAAGGAPVDAAEPHEPDAAAAPAETEGKA